MVPKQSRKQGGGGEVGGGGSENYYYFTKSANDPFMLSTYLAMKIKI